MHACSSAWLKAPGLRVITNSVRSAGHYKVLARELFDTVQLALAKGRSGVVLLLDEAQLVHDARDRHGEHPCRC